MMNFLERILRMPRVVLTVMALLLVAGFGAYMSLPKESFPAIDIPYFYVSVSQTGVSPRDAERLLAKPIEDRLKDIDGLENYHLDLDHRPRLGVPRVQRQRRQGQGARPTSAPRSTAFPPSCRTMPRADGHRDLVLRHPDDLGRRLRRRAGARAGPARQGPAGRARGHRRRAERDHLRFARRNARGHHRYQPARGLQPHRRRSCSTRSPRTTWWCRAVRSTAARARSTSKVPGLITTAQDVYTLPLKTEGDTVVTFGDVATITRTFEDATNYAHVNGQPAITLGVHQEARHQRHHHLRRGPRA